MIRLPFALPSFSRITWASSAIRATWAERLTRVRDALGQRERPAYWSPARPSSLLRIYPYQQQTLVAEAGRYGLVVQRLEELANAIAECTLNAETASEKCIVVAVGKPESVEAAKAALRNADLPAFQQALGTPECCASQLRQTKALGVRSRELALFLSCVPTAASDACVDLPQQWQTNLFWQGVGVSLLAHVPCSLACRRSHALAEELLTRMKNGDLEQEAIWLQQMLSWSLSWSSLHGIAELKTPLFKASLSTEATAERLELRLRGTSPEDAAVGIGFPYRSRSVRQSRR